MKRKNILIIIIIIVVIFGGVRFADSSIWNRGELGLKQSGTVYDNRSDFSGTYTKKPDEFTKAVLDNISYEIVSTDKEKMTVTLEISIPDLSNVLVEAINDISKEKKDLDYDQFKDEVKEKFLESLKHNKLKMKKSTITLPVEKSDDNSYKIMMNDEWDNLIMNQFKDMFYNGLKSLMEE